MSPITVPLAFAAGLLSFISPCVLPLVPAYLSYLSGSSLSGETPPSRRQFPPGLAEMQADYDVRRNGQASSFRTSRVAA